MARMGNDVGAAHRKPVPSGNALATLDEEVSAILRDPRLEPVKVHPGRHGVRRASKGQVQAVHAPALAPRPSPDDDAEYMLVDLVTLEVPRHGPTTTATTAEYGPPVLSRERSRGRQGQPAQPVRAGEGALIAAGVAIVGGLLGLLVVLASGYGAT